MCAERGGRICRCPPEYKTWWGVCVCLIVLKYSTGLTTVLMLDVLLRWNISSARCHADSDVTKHIFISCSKICTVVILLSLNKKFTCMMIFLSGWAGISCSEDEYLSSDIYFTLVLGVVQSNAQSHFSGLIELTGEMKKGHGRGTQKALISGDVYLLSGSHWRF